MDADGPGAHPNPDRNPGPQSLCIFFVLSVHVVAKLFVEADFGRVHVFFLAPAQKQKHLPTNQRFFAHRFRMVLGLGPIIVSRTTTNYCCHPQVVVVTSHVVFEPPRAAMYCKGAAPMPRRFVLVQFACPPPPTRDAGMRSPCRLGSVRRAC
jgi:hypothetical protein